MARYVSYERSNLEKVPEDLPPNTTSLDLSHNDISEIPVDLPENLKCLYLNDNSIKEIPETLPRDIRVLNVPDNYLSSLPKNLPRSLESLGLSRNYFTDFPENLPSNLTHLYLNGNLIKEVPGDLIPEGILVLRVSGNQITKLKDLTLDSIQELWMDAEVKLINCFLPLKCRCYHRIRIAVNRGYGKDYTKEHRIEAMSYRYGSRRTTHLDNVANRIKGHFELLSLRNEGTRFRKAVREYDEVFGV